MKRISAFALALMLALTLAACSSGSTDSGATETQGGNNQTEAPAGEETQSTEENDGGNDAADLTTIEGYLAAFGLTEEDLKPAHFTRLDATSKSIDSGVIKEVGAYVSQELTDEEVKAWLDQVLGKLGSLSAEGKVDNVLADGDLTSDQIMSKSMYLGTGAYTYNGKQVDVTIFVMPGYLDSDDPDDAMAACALQLTYR
jgi:hypothetical protein